MNFLFNCLPNQTNTIYPLIHLAAIVVHVLQFAIPIALIIFGMIDLGKAVIAGKEDEMKKAQGILIKRVIYAVLIFFVITLVGFIMGIVGDASDSGDTTKWSVCWNRAWKGETD